MYGGNNHRPRFSKECRVLCLRESNMKKTVFFVLLCALIQGCTGLSQQIKATREGIAINYTVNKERFVDPKVRVLIVSTDERVDKEVIGDGAKPTVGTRFMGYIAFGVLYAAMPDQPTLKDQEDPARIFKTAMAERLSKNGVAITNDKEKAVIIDLLVRQFKIDFNFGKWSGEVGYVARVKKNGEIICESNIYEKANAFNLYGFGSGEKAINEAFNNAINKLDINSCFLKLQK
jgi:hypothetical protein